MSDRLSFSDYSRIRGVSWSALKNFRESPRKYHYHQTHPTSQTLVMAMGRALHAAVFEPEIFASEFVIFPGPTRKGKVWDAFKAENEGLTIFKANEADHVLAMANAVRTDPIVAPYLDKGEFETSIAWTDEISGLQCKGRVDWKNPEALVELKSTSTIDGFSFGRMASRMGYHLQLSHYRNGLKAGGFIPKKTLIVAVEYKPPYDVGVFVIDEDTLYLASEEVSELLIRLAAHKQSGQWPGRYIEEQALQLPAWIYGSDDADAGELGITFGSATAE